MALKCHVKVTDSRITQIYNDQNQHLQQRPSLHARSATTDATDMDAVTEGTPDEAPVDLSQMSNSDSCRYIVLTLHPAPSPLVNGNAEHWSQSPQHSILKQITDELISAYGYPSDIQRGVLKFTNVRGSHIPLSHETIKNCGSSRNPLLVEICDRYSMTEAITPHNMNGMAAVTPMHPQREKERVSVARNTCTQLNARLTKLEEAIANRPTQRNLYIQKQLADMAECIDRLQNIINITSHSQWQGTIRRNPLW